MEIKLCRICGKQEDNYIHIFKTEGLKNKIETCLPIVVMQTYSLPDTICTRCLDTVDNFYSFIKNCLQNIIVLEAQYEIIESCLKTKRKVDRSISVEPFDLPVPILPIPFLNSEDEIKIKLPILDEVKNNLTGGLVDYECSDSESDSEQPIKSTEQPSVTNIKVEVQSSKQSDIIDEIVQRKCLKRKFDSSPSPSVVPAKQPRHEETSCSRRKSSRPKRVEYHLESPVGAPEASPAPQTCLMCDTQLSGLLPLAAHMYEVHGLDLTQGGPTEAPPPKRKIPELVKISDVIGLGKLPPKLTVEVVGGAPKGFNATVDDTLEITQVEAPPPAPVGPPEPRPTPMSSLNDSLFLCSECPGGRRPFTSFQDFSTHRRAQHQIFHCDLCPKFYGRNSHLWKHVNRVHKGHSAVTCSECGKTSASEYHLQQHKNKMHAGSGASTVKESQQQQVVVEKLEKQEEGSDNHGNSDIHGNSDNYGNSDHHDNSDNHDDEDVQLSGDDGDLLNQKFQGFDFKSVRQSFLRQELMNKRQRYVSVLKKNNVFDDNNVDVEEPTEKAPTPPPKEIDSSSDLYTTIITNYTPPTNEGPYKCPKCLKGFHKKNLVKKHKKNCRPRLQKDLLTRCKTCARIFKDRQSLAKHLVNYHSEYTCEICNLAVQSKCEIVSHIRFTHPGSELQCHCGQILRSRGDLLRHKSEHRDSHVCQFCGDQLPTKIKLKMHILSLHRKILALSCGICLKLFETQHVLRAHVKHAHADQLRPLTSCTVCGKNYGSKWKTYDHLNKSHGRIFKACKACLEVFETERDLQMHFEREHVNHQGGAVLPTAAAAAAVPPNTKHHTPPTQIVKQKQQQQVVKTVEPVKKMSIDEFDEVETMEYYEKHKNGGAKTLSLLEKRLLSKKSKSSSDNFDLETDPPEQQDDILQNSSKRTVYVNSNDPSLCEICLKVWPAKKHLWQHYIRCHKTTASTVCGICLKTNPSYSALQRHLQDTHPRLLHGQGFGSNFICKICGRYHNASSKLRLHMAIHVGHNSAGGDADDEDGAQLEPEDEEEKQEEEVEDETQEDEVQVKREVKEEVEEVEEAEDEFEDEQTLDDADYEEASPQSKGDAPTRSSNSNDSNDEEEDDSDGDDDSEVEEVEEVEEMEELDDEDGSEAEASDADQEILQQEVKSEAQDEDDVYYESLIEEIEASEDDLVEDESQESRSSSPRDLEREMLRNMMCESRSQRLHVKAEPLDSSSSSGEQLEDIIEDLGGENDDEEVFQVETYDVEVIKEELVKTEVVDELDSAIRSICGGGDTPEPEDGAAGEQGAKERYRRIHRVNESELETAVGSIL